MRHELDQMTEVPRFAAENEPRIDIGHFSFDLFQICNKVFPCGRRFEAKLIEDFLVIEEARHGHVRADAILFSTVDVGAAFTHRGDQSIPDLVHVGQIKVLALVNIFLLVGCHNIRGFAGGKFDLDDIACVVLIFLFNGDAAALRIEGCNDLIEKINRFHLAGEEGQIDVLGRLLGVAALVGRRSRAAGRLIGCLRGAADQRSRNHADREQKCKYSFHSVSSISS